MLAWLHIWDTPSAYQLNKCYPCVDWISASPEAKQPKRPKPFMASWEKICAMYNNYHKIGERGQLLIQPRRKTKQGKNTLRHLRHHSREWVQSTDVIFKNLPWWLTLALDSIWLKNTIFIKQVRTRYSTLNQGIYLKA